MRFLYGLSILGLGLILAAAPPVPAKDFSFAYQRVIEPEGDITLDLSYLEGDLEIVGNDEGRLIIDAVKHIKAVSKDEAESVQGYIEIKTNHSGNKVEVETNYLRMRDRSPSFWEKIFGHGGNESYGEVDWKISAPEGCNVVITNTDGDINISHLRGSVTVNTSASNVKVSSVEGDVLVKNANGDTGADLVFGNVEVHQPRGEIDLQWIDGTVWAVVGGKLYENPGSSPVDRGSVGNSEKTSIAGNTDYVCVVSDGDYYVWNGATLTTPTTGAFSSVGSCDTLNNYVLLTQLGGRKVQWSAVGDPTSFNALDFATTKDQRPPKHVHIADSSRNCGDQSIASCPSDKPASHIGHSINRRERQVAAMPTTSITPLPV